MLVPRDLEREKYLQYWRSRESGHSFDFSFEVSAKELPYILYELNGWIGGYGDRVIVLKGLQGSQPSFDALWMELIDSAEDVVGLPCPMVFKSFDYQILDQLSGTIEKAKEVQRLLGYLALAISGGCSLSLFSSASRNMLDVGDEVSTLYSNSQYDILSGRGKLEAYGIVPKT